MCGVFVGLLCCFGFFSGYCCRQQCLRNTWAHGDSSRAHFVILIIYIGKCYPGSSNVVLFFVGSIPDILTKNQYKPKKELPGKVQASTTSAVSTSIELRKNSQTEGLWVDRSPRFWKTLRPLRPHWYLLVSFFGGYCGLLGFRVSPGLR